MKTFFFSIVLVCSSYFAFGQFELGVKLGASSSQLSEQTIFAPNGNDEVEISIADVPYGFHFGLYSRIKIFNIYLEPALLFNSSTVDYNIQEEIFDTGVVNTIRSETFNNLDIPLLVGMKFGFFRIQAGPVAHIFISSASELTAIEGYAQKVDEASFGLQGGIGIDILRVRLDFNYETNLSRFGDHITIGGQEFSFDDRPTRFVASMGIKF